MNPVSHNCYTEDIDMFKIAMCKTGITSDFYKELFLGHPVVYAKYGNLGKGGRQKLL